MKLFFTFLLTALPSLIFGQTCTFPFVKYRFSECNPVFEDSVSDIIADGRCNAGPINGGDGPGPFYSATCDNAGTLLFFLSAQCSDPSCTICNTNSNSFVANNDANGWDVSSGDCNALDSFNSFKVLGTPTRAPSPFPTVSPTVPRPTGSPIFPQPSPSPTPEPTESPTSSASPSASVPCDWGLDYFGEAGTTSVACRFRVPDETDIVADGSCQFNSLVNYYRAICTDIGGALTFTQAHCEQGCINCQPFTQGDPSTPSTSFIGIGIEYNPGFCYLINDSLGTGTVAHSWTVSGTCRNTCELASDAPTSSPTSSPTVSPTSTPTIAPTVTNAPTDGPTEAPTDGPTAEPTASPSTAAPTSAPTKDNMCFEINRGSCAALMESVPVSTSCECYSFCGGLFDQCFGYDVDGFQAGFNSIGSGDNLIDIACVDFQSYVAGCTDEDRPVGVTDPDPPTSSPTRSPVEAPTISPVSPQVGTFIPTLPATTPPTIDPTNRVTAAPSSGATTWIVGLWPAVVGIALAFFV
jgi:hypothetical protein